MQVSNDLIFLTTSCYRLWKFKNLLSTIANLPQNSFVIKFPCLFSLKYNGQCSFLENKQNILNSFVFFPPILSIYKTKLRRKLCVFLKQFFANISIITQIFTSKLQHFQFFFMHFISLSFQ